MEREGGGVDHQVVSLLVEAFLLKFSKSVAESITNFLLSALYFHCNINNGK